jgi:DNA-binding PadR family transcriptional regulator
VNKKSSSENKNLNDIWESITMNYDYVEGAQISNSLIILLILNESKEPLTTTQISEKIALNSKGKIFKISGTFKDSLELRLKKAGYVNGFDIPTSNKSDKKSIRRSLYSITPKGQKLLKGWLAFLSALT